MKRDFASTPTHRRMGGARKSSLNRALREPVENNAEPSSRFDSVRNPPSCRRFASRTLHPALLVLCLAAAVAAQSGCGPAGGAQTKISGRAADASAQWSEDLFSFALENLNHLEDNDCEEMLRSTQRRLAALQQPDVAGKQIPSDNLLASWPEPDMLRQVVNRLNQWVDTQEKPADWKPDPMLSTLPPELRKLPMVENLDQPHFTSYDGYMLMEAVWARDAAKWASGNTTDELLAARKLFDWTVRNIANDYDKPDRPPQVPWETLFLGRGLPWERAWTYVLLLRQRGIDAAVLAVPGAESAPESLRPWCVGVLIGDKEKKLYLFDLQLGLPIPAPGGIAADKSGQLDVQPATLDQVREDPKLLERLAQGTDKPYWVKADDLKGVVALVESSPLYLSPRARRIESRLTGEQRLVLNAEPSQQAARFKAAGVAKAEIWQLPYRTLERRLALGPKAVFHLLVDYISFIELGGGSLYKGRVLHLKGRLVDEQGGAIAYYQRARPRDRDVLAGEQKHVQALYGQMFEQAKEQLGDKLTPEVNERIKERAALLVNIELQAILQGKLDASYWLGLIEYDQGQYPSALDYFNFRVLPLDHELAWAAGAHYNVGRSLEAGGQRAKAIKEYESSGGAGNLVRAAWLRVLDSGKSKIADEGKLEEKKIGEKKMEEK